MEAENAENTGPGSLCNATTAEYCFLSTAHCSPRLALHQPARQCQSSCLPACRPVYLRTYLPASPHAYFPRSFTFMPTCLTTCLSFMFTNLASWPTTYLPALYCMCAHLNACLPACLPASLSGCPHICPSLYRFIRFRKCLFTSISVPSSTSFLFISLSIFLFQNTLFWPKSGLWGPTRRERTKLTLLSRQKEKKGHF